MDDANLRIGVSYDLFLSVVVRKYFYKPPRPPRVRAMSMLLCWFECWILTKEQTRRMGEGRNAFLKRSRDSQWWLADAMTVLKKLGKTDDDQCSGKIFIKINTPNNWKKRLKTKSRSFSVNIGLDLRVEYNKRFFPTIRPDHFRSRDLKSPNSVCNVHDD
jgi:hypothetical protein